MVRIQYCVMRAWVQSLVGEPHIPQAAWHALSKGIFERLKKKPNTWVIDLLWTLAHMSVEAKKSHTIHCLQAEEPGRLFNVIPVLAQRPGNQEHWYARAGEDVPEALCSQSAFGCSPLIGKDGLPYSVCHFKCFCPLRLLKRHSKKYCLTSSLLIL